MCDRVIIHYCDDTPDRIAENQKQLKIALIPDARLWFHPPPTASERIRYGYEPLSDTELLNHGYEPEICLCPVDLDKTAEAHHMICSKYDPDGEWDAFDTHFYEVGPYEEIKEASRKFARGLLSFMNKKADEKAIAEMHAGIEYVKQKHQKKTLTSTGGMS